MSAAEPCSIKPEPQDDIKDYAETTMNELLGWYGYEKVDSKETRSLLPNLQHYAPASSPSTVDSEDRAADLGGGPGSPLSNDSSSGGIICSWCQKFGMKLFTLRTTSGVKAFCSEICFTQCRRASFKKNKICDWCKHVRHTVNYVDFQDGEQQLQFCSDKCLNQYKMNIFCKETQAHLQMHTHLKEGVCNKGGPGNAMNLITPDLWLKDCCKTHATNNNNNNSHNHSASEEETSPSTSTPQESSSNNRVATTSPIDHISKSSTASMNSPFIDPLTTTEEKESPHYQKTNKHPKEKHHRHHHHHKFAKSRHRKVREHPGAIQGMKNDRNSSSKSPGNDFPLVSSSVPNGSPLVAPPKASSRPMPHPHFPPLNLDQIRPPPPPLMNNLNNMYPGPLNLMTHPMLRGPHPGMGLRPGLPPWMIPPPCPPPHNPTASLLPPTTITVPYPIFIPVPIPIPIPLPLEVFHKAYQKPSANGEPAHRDTPINYSSEVLNLTNQKRQVSPLRLKRETFSPQNCNSNKKPALDHLDYSSFSETMSTDDDSRHEEIQEPDEGNRRDYDSCSPFEPSISPSSLKQRGWTLEQSRLMERETSPLRKKRCLR